MGTDFGYGLKLWKEMKSQTWGKWLIGKVAHNKQKVKPEQPLLYDCFCWVVEMWWDFPLFGEGCAK